jgi:hypothetical protein
MYSKATTRRYTVLQISGTQYTYFISIWKNGRFRQCVAYIAPASYCIADFAALLACAASLPDNKNAKKIFALVLGLPKLSGFKYSRLQIRSKIGVSNRFMYHMHKVHDQCLIQRASVVCVSVHRALICDVLCTLCVIKHVSHSPCPQDTSWTTSLFCRTEHEQPMPRPGCVYRGSHGQTSSPHPCSGPLLGSHIAAQPRTRP